MAENSGAFGKVLDELKMALSGNNPAGRFDYLNVAYEQLKESYHNDLAEYYRRELSLTLSPVVLGKYVEQEKKENLDSKAFDECIKTLREIKDPKINISTVERCLNKLELIYDSLHRHNSASKDKSACATKARDGQGKGSGS